MVFAVVADVLGRVTDNVESVPAGEDAARVGDAESPPAPAVRAAFGSVPHAARATSRNTGSKRLFTHESWQFLRVSAGAEVTDGGQLP